MDTDTGTVGVELYLNPSFLKKRVVVTISRMVRLVSQQEQTQMGRVYGV